MFEKNKQKICVQRKESKENVEKCIEKTINKENTWDQKIEIGIVEGPVEEVSSKKITLQ